MAEQNEQTDFLEELGKLNVYAQSYLKDQVEYAKIRVTEESIKTISSLTHIIVLSSLSLLVIFFLSIVLGLFLGEKLESYVFGFLLVSLFYVVLMLTYIIFRKRLVTNPIAKTLIKRIFGAQE